jgi:hypothetical protein
MSKLLIELNAHITIVKEVSEEEVTNDSDIAEITDNVISDIDASLNKMFFTELLNADIYRTSFTTEQRS